MSTLLESRDWTALVSLLPADFRELARQHKQLQTQYGNAKITTAEELLRFLFLHVGANLPLRQTVAMIAEAGGPELSPMRVHKKMRRAAPYLHALVLRMMEGVKEAEPERWGGYELVAIDATAVMGPGAEGVDARIHTVLRLRDACVSQLEVTGVSEGETFKRFPWAPGQLVLGDRGYSNPQGIAKVVADGADVLVRVNRGALPLFDADGQIVDVIRWLRSIPGHRASERAVHLRAAREGDETGLPGRLLAIRLPPEEAAQAKERVLREQGNDASAETIEASGYVFLFTTAPRQRLSAARAIEAYRLRWQVELQFKRWKTIAGFDRLPTIRSDTTLAWLYAKTLLGLLLQKASSAATELSPPRAALREPDPARRRARPSHGTRGEWRPSSGPASSPPFCPSGYSP